MKGRDLSEVRIGLLTGCKLGLLICWIVAVSFSLGEAASDSFGRRVAGIVFLVLAAILAIATAHLWIKILPGLLGLEIINVAIAVLLGHSIANPAFTISRVSGVGVLLVLVVSSVMANTYQSRPLGVIDRVFLLLFVASQVLAISRFPSVIAFLPMLMCLFAGWSAYRLRSVET